MGLVIITTGDQEQERQIPPKDPGCKVCNAERPEGFANDIEKIVLALEQYKQADLGTADKDMCDAHSKKAQGFKIFISNNELFELDPMSSSSVRNPVANKISEDEYNKEAEITDVETTM